MAVPGSMLGVLRVVMAELSEDVHMSFIRLLCRYAPAEVYDYLISSDAYSLDETLRLRWGTRQKNRPLLGVQPFEMPTRTTAQSR